MSKQSIHTFEDAKAYLESVPRFRAENTMEDLRAFLRLLGNPDRKMKIIHVAGTNGKGSVCAYLRYILEAAGYRVALFTSPHLEDIRERFVVDGEMVSQEDFLRAFLQIYDMSSVYQPSWFEYLFLIAMILFPERHPDYCILETGLGGRLDATNAVSKKEISVITHISLDHVQYLGDTVAKIAGEKAGIMQAGAPVVFWDTCPETTEVFEACAEKIGISWYPVSKKDYRFSNFKNKSIDFSVRTRYYGDNDLTLHTIATYQMENAALAVRAIEVLDGGKTITLEHIRNGLKACFWAGRMEEVLPGVYVDGAHNEDGVRAFLESVGNDGVTGGRSLLFGVVKDKDYEHMAAELVGSGLFQRFAIVRMQTGRGVEPAELARIFAKFPGCTYKLYDNVTAAFHELLHSQGEGERIYAAGSLYLAGEIKELLKNDKF